MSSILPNPVSVEADAMIETVLAEYNYPSNSKNAARAGFEAARRLLIPSKEVRFGTEEQRMKLLRDSIPPYDTSQFSNLTNQASGFVPPKVTKETQMPIFIKDPVEKFYEKLDEEPKPLDKIVPVDTPREISLLLEISRLEKELAKAKKLACQPAEGANQAHML